MSDITSVLASPANSSSEKTMIAAVVASVASGIANNASVAAVPMALNSSAHNFSINATVPWDDQEKMTVLFRQWMKFENLPWGPLLIGLITVLFGIIKIFVRNFCRTSAATQSTDKGHQLRYPLWRVIGTIAIAEAPQTTFHSDRRPSHEKKHDDGLDGTTAAITQQHTVTSSVRAALRHLYRIAGIPSFYRALAITICIHIAEGMLALCVAPATTKGLHTQTPQRRFEKHYSSQIVDSVLTMIYTLLLCQWYTARTHILLTTPTLRIWYRRLPPFWKTLKATWLAETVSYAAYKITFNVPHDVCRLTGLYRLDGYLGPLATGNAVYARKMVFCLIWLFAQIARIELLVPANVVLTRIQTSLLPPDEDTIVPIDTTFGTSVGTSLNNRGNGGFAAPPPGILAPDRGAISLRAAWKSYDRVERRRILSLYAKFVLVEAALSALFWCVLGNEVWPGFWNPSL